MLPQLAITLSLLSWEPDNWFGQAAGLVPPAECAEHLPSDRRHCQQPDDVGKDAPSVLDRIGTPH